jgi:hypothetical protein
MDKRLNKISNFFFITVSFLLISTGIIFAGGPPWRTDDPIPVEFKQHELYLFSTGVSDDGGVSGVGPAVEFNYGVFPSTQFHIVLPLAFDAPKDGKKHFGYGDTELGIKYRFVEQGNLMPAIATFPIAELPTGNASESLGNGKTQLYLPIWFQKDIGSWTVCTGTGYWINPGTDNKNWQFFGLQAQYNFSDEFYLGAEIFHQTASTINSNGYTGIHVGGAVSVVKNYQILFSGDAGNGITSYKHFSYYLGLYHEF